MSSNIVRRFEALADEPLYCEADPTEIIYPGSDDDEYDSPGDRRWAYEKSATRFLDGGAPFLLTSRLRGPFSQESGWTNPWRSKTARITKPIASVTVSKTQNHRRQPVDYLPSSVSLENKTYDTHGHLDKEDVAKIENWRTSIDYGHLEPDTFWAPAAQPSLSRKRYAQSGSWLKRTEKRCRTSEDAAPTTPSAANNAKGRKMKLNSHETEEDELLQVDVELDEWTAVNAMTPTRKSPPRRGLRHSPIKSSINEDSDDELSRPSPTPHVSRVWCSASARSQVSRHDRHTSPTSSPSKLFVRGKPASVIPNKPTEEDAAGDEAEFPEWETQQDNSFILRARRKPLARSGRPLEELPVRPSSPLSSGPDEISDFTSLGTHPDDDAVMSSIVSVSPKSEPHQDEVMEDVPVSLRATPESSIIGTSQPELESSTLVEQEDPHLSANNRQSPKGLEEHETIPATNNGTAAEPQYNHEPCPKDSHFKFQSTDGPGSNCSSCDDHVMDLSAHEDTKVSNAEQYARQQEDDRPTEAISSPQEKLENGVAGPKSSPLNVEEGCQPFVSPITSPGLVSATSNEVQGQVEEQILLESSYIEDVQPGGMEAREARESAAPAVDVEQDVTPDKLAKVPISQQTPWQAVPRGDLGDSRARLSENLHTPSTASVAFSQGAGSVPPISQQTPWYQATPLHHVSRDASALNNVATPIKLNSSTSQSPWTKSLEQMRTAAQIALSAAGIKLVLSRGSQSKQAPSAPESLPEETHSLATGETPSRQTSPLTPGNDAPDTIFIDASSSPTEARLSSSAEADSPEEGFTLKPFAAFRSPSPDRAVLRPRISRVFSGSSRSILAATTNSRTSTPRKKKRVSWAPREESPETDGCRRTGRSSTVSTPSRVRGSSPPPEQALADLPTGEKDAFQKHFSAVKMKVKGHSHRILPTASQQVLRSPAPTAMADAFLTADQIGQSTASPSDTVAEDCMSPPKDMADEGEDATATQGEEIDEVDEVLRNLGDFIDIMDVETDIQQAKAGSVVAVPEKQSKGRISLTSELKTSVWELH